MTDPPADEPTRTSNVRLVARQADMPPGGARRATDGLAWLWQLLGQAPEAREQWSELVRLAVTSAERPVRAETLNVVGRFALAAGDLTTAHSLFHEALIAGRASQEAASVARSLTGLAQIAASRVAFDLARALQEEALAIQQRRGDAAEAARSLAVLGWLAFETRGAAPAEALHEESLTLRVTLGEPLALAYSLVHLGWLAHLTGRRALASQHLAEALTTVRACGDRWKVVALLALLGRPSSAETLARQAVRVLVAAEALEASTDVQANDAAGAPDHLATAQAHLDARALAIAWSGGHDVDAAGLVEQVLRAADPLPLHDQQRNRDTVEPMLLTPRELEVARLIGQGHTNRRIAEELVIAERTAETHARNIREKLGLTTRSQVAAWAAINGLSTSP